MEQGEDKALYLVGSFFILFVYKEVSSSFKYEGAQEHWQK